MRIAWTSLPDTEERQKENPKGKPIRIDLYYLYVSRVYLFPQLEMREVKREATDLNEDIDLAEVGDSNLF